MQELKIQSPAFRPNQEIPEKYGCEAEGINPPLTIDGKPEGTRSLALVMDDPDAKGNFEHWIMWNIPPSTSSIAERSAPGIEGLNSAGTHGYTGPCPPSGTHHYRFKAYALDMELGLSSNARKKDLENAMKGHILAQGELVGLFTSKQ